MPWRDWMNSEGKEGEEPPAWVKRLYQLADEWLTVLPGSERYMEIGREMVAIHLDNLPIIGTVGDVRRAGNTSTSPACHRISSTSRPTPGELHDLAQDPAHGETLATCARHLLSWRMTFAERTLSGTSHRAGGPRQAERRRRIP